MKTPRLSTLHGALALALVALSTAAVAAPASKSGSTEATQSVIVAYKAGLAPGLTLVAVNMSTYKAERLAEAIKANTEGTAPIQLLLREGAGKPRKKPPVRFLGARKPLRG